MHDVEKYFFAPLLWNMYGRELSSRTESLTIRLMNAMSVCVRSCLFAPGWLRDLEHIADIVDRYLDPAAAEEFGREMHAGLEKLLKTQARLALSRMLVKNHKTLFPELDRESGDVYAADTQ
jgi:hypothetical protein